MADTAQTFDNVSVGGGKINIQISSDPTNCTITANKDSSCDWITVNPPSSKGYSFEEVFVVSENTTTSSRSGKVYISATTESLPSEYSGVDTKTWVGTINQNGKVDYKVNASIANTSVDNTTTSNTITINSNTDWKISSSDSWITIGTSTGNGDGTSIITFDANTGSTDRSATFKISSTNTSALVNPTSLTFTQKGVTKSITAITINSLSYGVVASGGGSSSPSLSYTVKYSDGSTASTGGSASYEKVGSGVGTVSSNGTVTYTENTGEERTTTVKVTVTAGGKSDSKTADAKQYRAGGKITIALQGAISFDLAYCKLTYDSTTTVDYTNDVKGKYSPQSFTFDLPEGVKNITYININGVVGSGTGSYKLKLKIGGYDITSVSVFAGNTYDIQESVSQTIIDNTLLLYTERVS